MTTRNVIRIQLESFMKSENYWIKNNALNLIEKIKSSRPLTKKQSEVLSQIETDLNAVKINYWQPELNREAIIQVKRSLEKLEDFF